MINEKNLHYYVIVTPVVFIIIIFSFMLYLIIQERNTHLQKEIKKDKERFLKEYKASLKNSVNTLFELIEYKENQIYSNLCKKINYQILNRENEIKHIYNLNKNRTKKEILEIYKDFFQNLNHLNSKFFFIDKSSKDINQNQFSNKILESLKKETKGTIDFYDKQNNLTHILNYNYFEPLDLIYYYVLSIEDERKKAKREFGILQTPSDN